MGSTKNWIVLGLVVFLHFCKVFTFMLFRTRNTASVDDGLALGSDKRLVPTTSTVPFSLLCNRVSRLAYLSIFDIALAAFRIFAWLIYPAMVRALINGLRLGSRVMRAAQRMVGAAGVLVAILLPTNAFGASHCSSTSTLRRTGGFAPPLLQYPRLHVPLVAD